MFYKTIVNYPSLVLTTGETIIRNLEFNLGSIKGVKCQFHGFITLLEPYSENGSRSELAYSVSFRALGTANVMIFWDAVERPTSSGPALKRFPFPLLLHYMDIFASLKALS